MTRKTHRFSLRRIKQLSTPTKVWLVYLQSAQGSGINGETVLLFQTIRPGDESVANACSLSRNGQEIRKDAAEGPAGDPSGRAQNQSPRQSGEMAAGIEDGSARSRGRNPASFSALKLPVSFRVSVPPAPPCTICRDARRQKYDATRRGTARFESNSPACPPTRPIAAMPSARRWQTPALQPQSFAQASAA